MKLFSSYKYILDFDMVKIAFYKEKIVGFFWVEKWLWFGCLVLFLTGGNGGTRDDSYFPLSLFPPV